MDESPFCFTMVYNIHVSMIIDVIKKSPVPLRIMTVEALSKTDNPEMTLAFCIKHTRQHIRKSFIKKGKFWAIFLPHIAEWSVSRHWTIRIQNTFLHLHNIS